MIIQGLGPLRAALAGADRGAVGDHVGPQREPQNLAEEPRGHTERPPPPEVRSN